MPSIVQAGVVNLLSLDLDAAQQLLRIAAGLAIERHNCFDGSIGSEYDRSIR